MVKLQVALIIMYCYIILYITIPNFNLILVFTLPTSTKTIYPELNKICVNFACDSPLQFGRRHSSN